MTAILGVLVGIIIGLFAVPAIFGVVYATVTEAVREGWPSVVPFLVWMAWVAAMVLVVGSSLTAWVAASVGAPSVQRGADGVFGVAFWIVVIGLPVFLFAHRHLHRSEDAG